MTHIKGLKFVKVEVCMKRIIVQLAVKQTILTKLVFVLMRVAVPLGLISIDRASSLVVKTMRFSVERQ